MLHDLLTYLPMFVTFFWSVILLLSKGKGNKAKFFLGVFMIVSFLLYLSHAIYFQKDEKTYLYFDAVYTFATLSVYPLFYWYIKLLTQKSDYRFIRPHLFIPALVISLSTAIIYGFMNSYERSHYIHHFLFCREIIPSNPAIIKAQTINYFTARIAFVFLVSYTLIKGHRLVIQYNKQVAENYSNLNNKTIGWVNQLLIAFVFSSLFGIVFNIIGRKLFLDSALLLAIPSLLFSVLLFFIGYHGYLQDFNVSNLDLEGAEQIGNENINKQTNNHLLQGLIDLFDHDEVFRQQELKISDLANLLNSNRTYISNLINTEFKCSFNDYVNRYRIAEAKRLIQDNRNESLEQIAIQVGYGSLSTFFRTFKSQEGITPNRFKKATEDIHSRTHSSREQLKTQ